MATSSQYATLAEYNAAHPDASMLADVDVRNQLRSFTASAAGLEDDLTGVACTFTLDFLPGGAPTEDDSDRIGVRRSDTLGQRAVLVLAEDVSLRRAWAAVTDRWPTQLSAAAGALSDVDLRDGSSS
jgi:hypothetical protein